MKIIPALLLLLASKTFSNATPISPEIDFTRNTLLKLEEQNKNVRFSNIHVIERLSVPQASDLEGVIVGFDSIEKDKFGMKLQEKHSDAFFITQEGVIVTQAFTSKGQNLMNFLVPTFEKSKYYKKKYLIYGKMDAKTKIMIFSDPFCPLCRNVYEQLSSKKEYDEVAIFFYEFPLQKIHPASDLIIPIIAQSKRKKRDITKSVYTQNRFTSLSQITDMSKMIQAVFKYTKFKTQKDELKLHDNSSLIEQHKLGLHLGVSSTPSVFINGQKASVKRLFSTIF